MQFQFFSQAKQWKRNLKLAALFGAACFFAFNNLASPSKAITSFNTASQNIPKSKIREFTNEATGYLDRVAKNFDTLNCPVDDHFCWWFLFHIKIGESGSGPMTEFARSVPVKKANDSFVGEAHIFQYPSYWAIKGVKSSTKLKSGASIEDYVYSKDWLWLFANSPDPEPSWYLMGKHFYPDLPEVSASYRGETACLGSHYLVGLSSNNANPALFKLKLNDYYERLHKAMQSPPEEAFKDPFKADLIAHAMETFCLSGRADLIDEETFLYTLKYLEVYSNEFDREIGRHTSLNDFVKRDSEIAYATAEMLGHFRNGLKVCAGIEPNRLRY